MKKTMLFILTLIMCAVAAMYAAKAPAYAANTCALVGKTEVRAGDTLNLTFSMNGTGIVGFTAKLEYDSSVLTFTGINQLISNPWMTEKSGDNIIVYDNSLNKPINTNTAVFKVVFNVKKTVTAGTDVNVRLTNIKATDGSGDVLYADAEYKTTALKPKSQNADAGSIVISNGTMTPEFSKSVTDYAVTVPYSETSLEITVLPFDSSSAYAIEGNTNFIVGENTVTVKITAENGNTKEYRITVTREQDPDYKPSSDASLSAIMLSTGSLSPRFTAECTNYIVFVPYETVNITISGNCVNKKASSTQGTYTLNEKNNVCEIICTAEDGQTQKIYTVNVYRMPKFTGEIPIIGDDTEPIPTPTPTPTDTPIGPDVTPAPTAPVVTPTPGVSDKTPDIRPTPTPYTPDNTPQQTPQHQSTKESVNLGRILLICIAVIILCIALIVLYMVFLKNKIRK